MSDSSFACSTADPLGEGITIRDDHG